MSEPVLEVTHLRREFGSDTVAVDDVSFRIGSGSILCLLGPNGAGKTTTVKMCATLLAPTSGGVTIDGTDAVARPRQARTSLGLVLGGERGFYLRARARDNLLFFADVLGVSRSARVDRVDEALEAVALTDRAQDAVQTFSRGMRQRLHIARALLNRPRLLLLDEPTSGLDPQIAHEIRELVLGLARAGSGILLTTHQMAEAEQLADSLAVIVAGRIRVEGSVSDIGAQAGVTAVSTMSFDLLEHDLRVALSRVPGASEPVVSHRDGRMHARISWAAAPDEAGLVEVIGQHGVDVPGDLVSRPATLEERYLALVEREGVR